MNSFLPFRALSLKFKITVLVLLLFLSAIWLLIYGVSERLEENFIEVLSSQQFAVASYVADDIDDNIDQRFHALKGDAANLTAELLADPDKTRKYLKEHAALQNLFKAGLVVIGKNGVIIADYPYVAERKNYQFQGLEYFDQVMATGAPAIGNPRIGKLSKLPIIAMATPILNQQNEVVAVLAGFTLLSDAALFGQLEKMTIGKSGYVVIDDPLRRVIVTSSDPKRIHLLTPMAEPGVNVMLDKFVSGFEGTGITTNSRGVKNLTSGKRIPATGWIVQIVLPADEAFAPIEAMKSMAYTIAMLLSTLLAFLTWMIIRRTFRPLDAATAAINEMASRKEGFVALPVSSSDEVGKLVSSFNTLVEERCKVEEALRHSKDIFQAIQLSITESILLLAPQGILIAINPTAAKRLGLVGADIIGKDLFNLMSPDVVNQRRTKVEEVFTTMKPLTFEDSKSDQIYSNSLYPVINEQGWCEAVVVVSTDISDRKEYELQLKAAKAAAEAASITKSEFLANMSHEIRTPMNGIIGLSSLALGQELPPKLRDYLSKISISAKALLSIINDILDYSKVEAGRLAIDSTAFSLESVIENVANLFAVRTDEKGLELTFEIGRDVPARFIGDPLRLGQVMNNLVGNAVKFTEAGEVHIKIKLIKQEHDFSTLCFTIEDTGIGMSPDQIERLFHSFTQADSSITRRFGGTGLGLTISQRLVELMGGHIVVDSALGQGSKFSFELRLAVPEGAQPVRSLTALSGMRVLVVDDQATSRQVLSEILLSWNFQVTEAASGSEALVKLREVGAANQFFELVLLDWKMPGMDGVEVAGEIRRLASLEIIPRMPIVIMATAYSKDDLLNEMNGIVIDGMLVKPVIASNLFDTIIGVQGGHVINAAEATQVRLSTSAAIRGARILLTEDNEINQQVAREILEQAGFYVVVANNGEQALAILETESFDAVLMDIQMPVMDGLEATRRIRSDARFNNLPIIAMTAAAMAKDQKGCLDAGMNDHVAKPISPEALMQALETWIVPGVRSAVAKKTTLETAASPMFPEHLAGLDIKETLRRLSGDHSLLAKLLKQFSEQFSSSGEKLDGLIDEGNVTEAVGLTHQLQGVAGNIGAQDVQRHAEEIEKKLKAGQLPVDTQNLRQALAVVQASIAGLPQSCDPLLEKDCESCDWQQADTLLKQLHTLLDEDDFVPHELFSALNTAVACQSIREGLARVEQHVGNIDYAKAREELAHIICTAARISTGGSQ